MHNKTHLKLARVPGDLRGARRLQFGVIFEPTRSNREVAFDGGHKLGRRAFLH